jgi:alpha-D-ribose 1-methylphosphonate 5-triphosphate synthase subunit PhnG
MTPKPQIPQATIVAARQRWMGLAAKAKPEMLAKLMPELPAYDVLRMPEIGTVMVRGRAGGVGAAFNLGEMSVTRCALRLHDGAVGHGYVQGRSKDHAIRAAVLDALMQGPRAAEVEAEVLAPLSQAAETHRMTRAAKAAATKVEFFTMVRGEAE